MAHHSMKEVHQREEIQTKQRFGRYASGKKSKRH